ncbi:MAG: FkbM family methyltransferase [Pseudomonadales bacterium]|nr:FkbM family methyltransferase [Pseudomonadales bacterium]
MHLFSLMKAYMAGLLMPVARFYIRFFPLLHGKMPLWILFHWREKNYTARTTQGIKMTGRSNDLVQGYIYYFGLWEPNLTAFIKKTLTHKDRTFIDVGANVGYFSLLASQLLPHGKVVAIEAFPSIFEKLKKNVRLNNYKNIRMINYAASDTECEIAMHHSIDNEGATTGKLHAYSVRPTEFESEPVVVKAKPLHQLLKTSEINNVRLIKIDVEGAEYEVLKGLYPLLNQLPKDAEIIAEITPSVLTQTQISEIICTFDKHGFKPYKISNTYHPEYYMTFKSPTLPELLTVLPEQQVDIIFSRQNPAA